MRDIWTRRIAFLLLGGLIGVYTPEPFRFLVLGIFIWLIMGIWLWKPKDFFGPFYRAEILVITAGMLVGLLYGQLALLTIERPLVLNQVVVTGKLLDWNTTDDNATGRLKILEPVQGDYFENNIEKDKSGQSLRAVDFIEKEYRLRVYPDSNGELPTNWQNVQPGDVIEFSAKLEHPNPPGTKGQFDFPLYYTVRGLSGTLTVKSDVEFISVGNPPFTWLLRNQVRELIDQISSEQAGVLEGILFGDTSRIPEDDLERYRITGVYHVFSASGSNVAFLLILCWGAFRFLPIPLRVGINIIVLCIYAVLCGGDPPILRATVMGIFVLLGRLGSGRGNSLRGLFIAALLLFVWQPLNLKDIGFQLSFMATWGIIVLSPRLENINFLKRWPKGLKLAFTTTCAAQIATLPLLVMAFHRFSLIGLLANVLILFILGSVFELGMIGVIFSFFPMIALPFFQASLWLLAGANEFLFFLANIPWADAWVVNPGKLFWGVWYGGILIYLSGKEKVWFTTRVWLSLLQHKLEPIFKRINHILDKFLPAYLWDIYDKIKSGLIFFSRRSEKIGIKKKQIIIIVIALIFLWSPWQRPAALTITFIDVGQGDSILIETPKGTRVLVDTGPKTERFDAGEQVILPFLLEKGINHLDALILTHAHSDHVGGAATLLKTIPVEWVGIPMDGRDWLEEPESLESYGESNNYWGEYEGLDTELVEQLAKEEIKILTAGMEVALDSKVIMNVLNPGEILSGTKSDDNNNSLVIKIINWDGQSALLTGDIEAEGMEEILKRGQDFDADIFKVPHHGSRSSLVTEMLDQMDPKAVFIPVGKNSFGHPASSVIEYWEERQVPIYRTDIHGTIEVKLNKGKMHVNTGRNIN